jgi:hypothetical protein
LHSSVHTSTELHAETAAFGDIPHSCCAQVPADAAPCGVCGQVLFYVRLLADIAGRLVPASLQARTPARLLFWTLVKLALTPLLLLAIFHPQVRACCEGRWLTAAARACSRNVALLQYFTLAVTMRVHVGPHPAGRAAHSVDVHPARRQQTMCGMLVLADGACKHPS